MFRFFSIKRNYTAITILTFVMLFSLALSAQEKKNLLFIMTDQQRYDALSIAGNSVLKTPNLDRLAQQGVYFQNAYTPSAVCCPARSSILTGHTIENTGMKNNDAYFNVDESKMPMPTFDEILSENGYHCEYYGKWHTSSYHAGVYQNPTQEAKNGKWIFGPGGQSHIYIDYLNENAAKPPQKQDEFIDLISKFPYTPDPLDRYYGLTASQLTAQNKKHIQPDQHGELQMDKEHTLTAFQAKETIDALERLKDKTFSITCSFHFPHSPMLPAEPYYSMYPPEEMEVPVSISDDMQNSPYKNTNGRQGRTEYSDPQKIKYMISNYYGLVSEIDFWVGEILNKLDELGLTDNTMVIFASDHGEMLGAHGMREKNVFYEESSHIPLMIRFPNEIEAGTTVEKYNSLIDLFPTILDYLGINSQESDGKSLRGLIEGTDEMYGKYVVTEWDFRGPEEPNYMVIKDGWKLMIPYTIKSNVLNAMYDLTTDPYEMNNLLGNNPDRASYLEKAEELRGCLLEWLKEKKSIHYYSVSKRDLLNGGKPTGNDAAFVSQNLPELMPGQTVSVSVTMKNTGTTTWTKEGNFKLAAQSPAENSNWGISEIDLKDGESVAPGEQKTFEFNIKVPEFDGSYNFQWQMLQKAEEWFGSKSKMDQLIIGEPGSYLDDCDENTDWKSSEALTLNETDQKQGAGCMEFSGDGTDEFKKVFSPSFDSEATETNGVLQFLYYVSDPSKLGDKNQVEIGSAGKPDEIEFNWNLSGLTEGWNFVTLNIKDAKKTGAPNLGAINWFRLYNIKSGSITSKIDAIQLLNKSTTGSRIDKISKENTFELYPNPLTGNILTIELEAPVNFNKLEISVSNSLGQVFYTNTVDGAGQIQIDTSNWLKNSIYFVSVKSEVWKTSKILIAR